MLQPKRTKFRKSHTGTLTGVARRGSDVSFGDFALQAVEGGYLTSRQIEAARMAIQRKCKREGKLFIRIFPDQPFTKKPLETRMGTGKGEPEYWAAEVRPGKVLFEIGGVPTDVAKKAFSRIAHKLPVKVRYVARRSM